jgi:uncharacterized protein involved in outer membrane biogenesis
MILGGFIAAVFLALYFLPSIFLRGYLEDYLADYGLHAEGLEEVHFNVFNMGLETGPLALNRGDKQIADLDGLTLFLGLGPLSQQRVDVTGARLTGLTLKVERGADGTISIPNLPSLASDGEDESAWVFGLTRLELADAKLAIRSPELSGLLLLDESLIENLKEWTPQMQGRLDLEARFEGAEINASMRVRPFTEELDIDFDIGVDSFPLDRLYVGPSLTGYANVALNGEIQSRDYLSLSVEGTASIEPFSIVIEGAPSVSLGSIRVDVEQAKASESADGLAWEFSANIDNRSLEISSERGPLLSFASAAIDALTADSAGQYAADSVLLEGLAALETQEQGCVFVERTEIGPVRAGETQSIELGAIVFGGVTVTLHRTAEGIAELSLMPGGEGPAELDGEKLREDASASLQLAVDEVIFADEAVIALNDASLAQPIQHELRIAALRVGRMDMAQPDIATDVSLDAAYGENTTLQLAGTVRPFAPGGAAFDVSGQLDRLALPDISAYAADAMGVNLKSGRLKMDFSGNAANGRLDAETDWLIQRIELEELDEFAKNSLAEQVDLPVDTAINLLQDKDGNIELNIPISGQLDDPNFGISGVVSKAIGNAI